MPTFLEDTIPPLTAGWLSDTWEKGVPVGNEIIRVVDWLEHRIVRSPPKSIHYLFDVARIAAIARLKDNPEITEYAMPDVDDPSPIELPPPSTMLAVCRLVCGAGQNRKALSLYVFYVALKAGQQLTWNSQLADNPPPHFVQCVKAFGEDCKFKRHGDLYLWSLIRLKVPAWLGASYPGHVAPWPAFALTFGDTANEVGRDMVGTPAVGLLDSTMIETEQFVVIVGLLLELTSAPGTILVNTLLLTADPDLPTPYASSDFCTPAPVYGYTYKGAVHHYDEPWTAAAAWLTALGGAMDGLVDVNHMVDFAGAAVPPPDNPFCKFLG
jgi:hypothetical protein